MSALHPDLEPIARNMVGKTKFEIQAIRDEKVQNIRWRESKFPELVKRIDDPAIFSLQRDRVTVAREKLEVAYLDSLLASPSVRGVP